MRPTMRYKQGDVLLVPFPFTDQSGGKQRPAVVLSSGEYNAAHPDVILAAITSQITRTPDEVILDDWQAAGLLHQSAVKPILSSFDITLVKRQLGTLSNRDLLKVRAQFASVFALT